MSIDTIKGELERRQEEREQLISLLRQVTERFDGLREIYGLQRSELSEHVERFLKSIT